MANTEEIKNLQKYKNKSSWKYFFYNLLYTNDSIYVSEKSSYLNKKTLKNNNQNIYLDGYWQNEKYFNDIEKVILKEFTLKNEFLIKNKKLKETIKNTNSISIHIRRSDYIKNKKTNEIHGVCTTDYYQKAIKKIIENNNNIHIFVFSDDILWAKNNLKFNFPISFIVGNKDYEDLILMSLCKHNIIANSSFSWWGAWLNKNPKKIVIAPQRWFNNLNKNKQNPIPQKWIRM